MRTIKKFSMVLMLVLTLTGCRQAGNGEAQPGETGAAEEIQQEPKQPAKEEESITEDEVQEIAEEKEEAPCCTFEPHVYSGKLSEMDSRLKMR